jgi:hypothetical protein
MAAPWLQLVREKCEYSPLPDWSESGDEQHAGQWERSNGRQPADGNSSAVTAGAIFLNKFSEWHFSFYF